jgi:hypothetical protein
MKIVKTEYKYFLDHNYAPEKTCIVDKLIQLEKVTEIKYRTLQSRFRGTNDYYDPNGKFRIRRVVYVKYSSCRGDRSRLPKKVLIEKDVKQYNYTDI